MRVLVGVASKHGATMEIGQAIGRSLRRQRLSVTGERPEIVTELDGFDAVVLGSAVVCGHWMDSTKAFATRFADQLAYLPVWLSSSGPIGDPPKPQETPAEVPEFARANTARSHRVFAGKLDKAKLGFGERAVVVAIRAPEGDFRDWADIEAWALEIADDLGAVRV